MMLEIFKFPISGMFTVGVTVLSLTLASAGLAQALPPLNQEKHINDSLISAGIAEMIRQNCGSISARILLALRKGKELEEYAMGLGYSKKEINRFIKSDVEKDRVRAAVM
ncbi:MAG: DUF5333 domain-containing protein, partial [Paracoccaceae bacterium]|nr:DUF5333 domain-containing protein [Paracoccaceae bacterium]